MPDNVKSSEGKPKGALAASVDDLIKKYSLLPDRRVKVSIGEIETKYKEPIRLLLKKGYSRAEVIKMMKADGVSISSKGLNKVFGRKPRKSKGKKGSAPLAK